MSVPISTIKTALKIDYSDDDTELTRLREVASMVVERRTQLKLQPGTESLFLADWTDTMIPVVPFNAITHVRYYNTANVLTTMTATDYWLDQSDGPSPVIRFKAYPSIYEGTTIIVTYTAGYSSIPDPLVHCIIALVGAYYNNPEAVQAVGLSTVPLSVEFILDHWSTNSRIR